MIILSRLILILHLAQCSRIPYDKVCQLTYCNPSYTEVPNLNEALLGYNPIDGNRLSLSDPGFKGQIFIATFEDFKETGDPKYKTNHFIDVAGVQSCKIVDSTIAVTSHQEYQQLKSGSIENSEEIMASFSVSAESEGEYFTKNLIFCEASWVGECSPFLPKKLPYLL